MEKLIGETDERLVLLYKKEEVLVDSKQTRELCVDECVFLWLGHCLPLLWADEGRAVCRGSRVKGNAYQKKVVGIIDLGNRVVSHVDKALGETSEMPKYVVWR